jgi:hypothetical protein
MRKGEGGKKKSSPNSSPTFISSDSEGCIACVPWQPFPGRAAPEDFQSVRKLSQTKRLVAGFTASVDDVQLLPEVMVGTLIRGASARLLPWLHHRSGAHGGKAGL